MAEKGDVSAEGSALVERDEDLDNLPRGIAVLTQMMQTVLQRIDAMMSVEEKSGGEVLATGSPPHQVARPEHQLQRPGNVFTGRGVPSVQRSSPPRRAGAQNPSPTEQQVTGSDYISQFIRLVGDCTVDVFGSIFGVILHPSVHQTGRQMYCRCVWVISGVIDLGVPSLRGTRGVRMPQGPKFDGSDTKFQS